MPPPTPPPGFTLSTGARAPSPPPGFELTSTSGPPAPPPGFTLTTPSTAAAKINTPPAPPPGFQLTSPGLGDELAGDRPWIQVAEQPLTDDEITTPLESLGQTAQEWGDVIGGIPEKVSASLAKTIASSQAQTFAELEQANAAAAALPADSWKRWFLTPGQGTPEKAAELRELTERELAIIAETNADLAPTEGATMAQSALEQAAISAPPSAVALATGILTRNPAAAAATMYPTTSAQGFGDMMLELDAQAAQQEAETLKPRTDEDRLAAIARAQRYGEREGALEVATEMLPMGALLKKGTPAVQKLAEVLLAELPGETVATLTQEINRQLALQPEGEATLDAVFKGLEEGGKQIPETLVASILGSAGQTAPIAAAEALASRSKTPQATPRIEPSIGEPEAAAADVDVEAQAGARFGEDLETAVAPTARTPSDQWKADPDAGEGLPFAFLGETPESAAGFLIENGDKIQAVTAAGDVVGEFDGPDQAAIALEDAVKGVQTPAPEAKTQLSEGEVPVSESDVTGFGDELGELGAPAMPREATPGEVMGTPFAPQTYPTAATADQRVSAPAEAKSTVYPSNSPDRRANRKRVADMTEDELRQSLLTHELTGIPNRRAYEEAPKLATQTAVDVDSLKWVNDNMGHDSGNELLKAVGEAIRAETGNAYHLSGDEFALQANTPEEAAAVMQRVNDRLAGAVISVTMPDGEVVTLSGMGVSYGSGKDLGAADAALQANKTQREAGGQRAGRGLAPPGATRFAAEEGREGDEGAATAEEQAEDRGGAVAEEEPTGEHVTLAGPFAHREAASAEKIQVQGEQHPEGELDEGGVNKQLGDELELGTGPGGSRRKPTTNTQNLEVAVRQMLGKAKNAPKYRFVAEDGLPADVQRRMKLQEGFVWKAAFDPVTHRVWMNQDEIRSAPEAAWYAMHEIAGHYGIKGAVGQLGAPDRTRINQALNLVAQNPYIDSLAEAYQQDREISRGQALEEALSELAAAIRTGDFARLERMYGLKVPGTFKGEKKTEAKAAWRRAFDRFVEAIKTIVKKLTGYNVSDAQVLELLEGAWRYVQTGEQLQKGPRVDKGGRDRVDVDDMELAELPADLKLEVDESSDGEQFTIRAVDKDGNDVGRMALVFTSTDSIPRALQVQESDVARGRRGQGIGQSLIRRAYEIANERAWRLVSDSIVSQAQLRAYESLKRQGWRIEYSSPKDVAQVLEDGGNVDDGPGVPVVKKIIPPPKKKRTEPPDLAAAYHGSRHKFDEFKLEHVGTGEGAQAFGWGLYFAESPGVARHYQTALTDRSIRLDALSPEDNAMLPSWIRERVNSEGKPGVESLRKDFKDRKADEQRRLDDPDYPQAHLASERMRSAQRVLALLDKIDASGEYGGKRDEGALFKVDIDDDAVARMIDADKPLESQKPAVVAALKRLEKALDFKFEWERSGQAGYHRIGNAMNMDGDVYDAAARELEGQKVSERLDEASSKLLAKFGIPGLRYLDEQSRVATVPDQAHEAAARDLKKNGYTSMAAMAALQEAYPDAPWRELKVALADVYDDVTLPGTRNIVVFDDSIVTIKEINGQKVTQKQSDAIVERSADAAELELAAEPSDKQTESPAFKKWFGDSVVAERDGTPLVMYHGTNVDFDSFKSMHDIGMHFGTKDQAGWRLADKTGDEATEGNRVVPVYLSIKNPLRATDAGTWDNPIEVFETIDTALMRNGRRGEPLAFQKAFRQRLADYSTAEEAEAIYEDMRKWLEKKGYDGIVYLNRGESSLQDGDVQFTGATPDAALREAGAEDSYIAFRPTQIKSAIGNRGTFDPANEDIALATGKKPPAKGGTQKISWKPGANYVEMYRGKGAPTAPTRAKLREGELEIPAEPIRAQHVMQLFQRLFKVKIYEGKPFSVRGALGYFRPSNFEVRNKYKNDLEVAAHEMFHWLDRTYPTIRALYHKRRYADELKGVSYDTTKIFEGFAEFGRLFLTQEPEAIERLPTFYEAFVKETRDVGILDKLEQVQKLMHQWYLQGAEARGRSKIGTSKAPIRQRLAAMADGFIDRAIASSLDARQAAKVIERETRGKEAFGDAANSPYKSIRLLGGARSTINTWLNYGTLKWTDKGDLERNGVGLRQIFEPIAGVFDEAMGYFVAQRADELRKYGKENLLAKDETEALRERARKTGRLEDIQRAHEQYQQYTKRLLSFAVQSGILSPETRDTWEQLYANYVPFYRVAEKFGSLDPRMAGGTQGSLFRKLKGGTANIADVFENITLNTALIVHASLKNMAMRQLFATIESSPVGQRYAVRIPTSTEVRNVSMEQIERVLKDFSREAARQGMNGLADKLEALELSQLSAALGNRSNDLGQATMSDIQSQATFFFTGRPPTIPDKQQVLVRGKPRWFQIGDPMLWDMLVDMNYHQPIGLTEKVFGIAKRTLTRGVTLSPEFQLRNMIRDTFNAFAMSKGGQTPIVDALKAIVDIWKESPAYVDFLANGGGFGNATGDEAQKLRVRMKATGRRRLIAAPAELLQFWDKWGQSFELATRLAEYKRIRAKGGTRREAAYQGREISTDFAMRGHSALARWASISLPFFNARMQGLYRIERELNENRGRQSVLRGERAIAYASRAFTGLTLPALLVYWFLNRGDDDYEELGEELKSLNTVIPGPDGTVLLIPRPFETGALFMEVPVRMLQYAEEQNGEQLVDAMMFMLANTFNFNPYPQLVQPPLAISRNRQWNGLPVVPRSLENVEPREQFQPWTPDTYKRVGEQFNVSPLKLQALVEGYFGTMGSYGVAASDALMQPPDSSGEEVNRRLSQWPLLRSFMREAPYTNTSFESRFYDMLDEVDRVVDTARKMRREARGDDLDAYLTDQQRAALFAISGPATDAMELAADLNAQMRAIRSDATLSGEEKLEQILELQEEQNTLFREAMEAFDEAMLEEARRALEQGQ